MPDNRPPRGPEWPCQVPAFADWHSYKTWRVKMRATIEAYHETLRFPDPHHFNVAVLPGLVRAALIEKAAAEGAYRASPDHDADYAAITRLELAREVLASLTIGNATTSKEILEGAREWHRRRCAQRERTIATARYEFSGDPPEPIGDDVIAADKRRERHRRRKRRPQFMEY
jgi:hypothetical protein